MRISVKLNINAKIRLENFSSWTSIHVPIVFSERARREFAFVFYIKVCIVKECHEYIEIIQERDGNESNAIKIFPLIVEDVGRPSKKTLTTSSVPRPV